MKKIILDTNFIVTALKFKIDLFSELRKALDFQYEIFILDKTIDELKKLKATLALKIINLDSKITCLFIYLIHCLIFYIIIFIN